MSRTQSSIFVFLAAAAMCLGFVSRSYAELPQSTNGAVPKVEYRGGIYYLVLDGKTPYERGIQHGTALEFPIKKALRQFKQWIRDNVGIEDPGTMIQDFAGNTGYLASVKRHVPDLYEEMEGVAEGAGVDLNELFVYQSFDEFFVFLWKSGALDGVPDGHCTTTGVFGRSDKPNYVGHNNDIPVYHEEVATVLHIKYPDSTLEILQSAFAGQIGQNGVNNRGVAVGINTIADLAGSDGVPVSFNVRKILESENIQGAVDYLKGTKFANAMNYMIGDREKVVSVETWETNAVVLDVYDGNYAVHANHTLQMNAPKTFEMTAESGGGSYGFTHERQELATKMLSADTAAVTREDFMNVYKTKPILVHPGKPTGRTLMNMIAEVPITGAPTLYLTPDSPNLFGHVKFSF